MIRLRALSDLGDRHEMELKIVLVLLAWLLSDNDPCLVTFPRTNINWGWLTNCRIGRIDEYLVG